MSVNTSSTKADYDTRRKRRNSVKRILLCLTSIRDAEQNYLDNVPENLVNSESFEVGECAVDALDEIIGLLAEVY